eukprot:TRINITY_DN10598_c0_g2_i2.p1 TRINITY_DN10598_c0_g2~~TRINITY_DN10598_c0_g2_i2.p1  ORF type:complete len:592 (+),score=95.92 TRINITY_DN10598_c0_g2_i2:227-2002(+)
MIRKRNVCFRYWILWFFPLICIVLVGPWYLQTAARNENDASGVGLRSISLALAGAMCLSIVGTVVDRCLHPGRYLEAVILPLQVLWFVVVGFVPVSGDRVSIDDSMPSRTLTPVVLETPNLLPPKSAASSLVVVPSREEIGKGRFSVVLPCAMEGEYMVKTVQSFCEKTPKEALQEIIVVDDGSTPSLESLMSQISSDCPTKYLKHDTTRGLMIAKQTGGDAAVGEFIGFFDCHVAPNNGWYKELRSVLEGGPRRLVVPTITDLDLDTWKEKEASQENTKCYIDFGVNFMWFDDESDFVPVISGGLVAMTREWWRDSAGFDSKMRGWGGENVDQSLRTWLCGGEILRAKTSRIAHMWRVDHDKRTLVRYKSLSGDNLPRVAFAWFDEFVVKFRQWRNLGNSKPPDVSNYDEVKKRLQCKPFAYFLHRFRKVYQKGNVLPDLIFRLRSKKTGRCISPAQHGFKMVQCNHAGFFHLSNQNQEKKGLGCCSGIRGWNTQYCFDRLDEDGPLAYACGVTGGNNDQRYSIRADGKIHHDSEADRCLTDNDRDVKPGRNSCLVATIWEQINKTSPEETRLYHEAVKRLGLKDDAPDN